MEGFKHRFVGVFVVGRVCGCFVVGGVCGCFEGLGVNSLATTDYESPAMCTTVRAPERHAEIMWHLLRYWDGSLHCVLPV